LSPEIEDCWIDIDAVYIEAGKTSIWGVFLSDMISLDKVDVSDEKQKYLTL
jgi:hypothetical protein